MKPVGRKLYSAFGSSMNPGQMARRLRDPWPIGPAILLDHLRIFPLHSTRWGGGVASVQPAAGHRLHDELHALLAPDALE
ncbi:MAG: hypothetical protein ACLFTN_11335 [Phycisphaerae bacterium]